ncbi:N-acetylmuramoyl-L-alanine amidase [Streptomyces sp. NPDC097619]|uniref:N-acetylmuramoyl-L-alanine amidase n=1 Tax=Streptomyces sp. NPDC097619 TaxID=3157228 RepID=UPI003333FCFE
MPYDESPPPPESSASIAPHRARFPRRSTVVVAVAVLAPAFLAGWVLTQVFTEGDGGRAAEPPALGAASPGPERSGDAKSAGDRPAASPPVAPSTAVPTPSAAGSSAPAAPAPGGRPLAGRTVVIDPGHNTGNFRHTSEINRKVDIGTGRKECDATGTTTNAGYKEAEFTLDVSRRLRTLLEQRGARVVLTHEGDLPFGPCIDERARIGNGAGADAVVSVHADGSSAGNRGFHVILPALVRGGAADTTKIVAPSRALGERIAGNFVRATGLGPSNYVGGGTGLVVRDDLGGLNLSTRPKVFVECGNMRDPKDAALLTSPQWRQDAARGIADGIVGFLGG